MIINFIENWPHIFKALVILAVGIPTSFILSDTAFTGLHRKARIPKNLSKLLSNCIFYVLIGSVLISATNQFGLSLSALLGAAGVAGIAIGFAARTTVSNIISGIFIIAEHSFTIGDTIVSHGEKGTVESIDLLAVKLRTEDNRLVRISNENILNKPLINLTYYSKNKS